MPSIDARSPIALQRWSPPARPRGLGIAVLTLMLATAGGSPLLARDPQPLDTDSDAPPGGAPAHAHPEPPWLDEVRAQRHAWEERRQAARDAFEARRRLADPRGAAHQEAWEEDVRRRREGRMQRMEQDRERFRGLSQPPLPWYKSQAPVPGTPAKSQETQPHPAETQAPGTGNQSAVTVAPPTAAPEYSPFSPQNWNNLWYYRGY